jgi:mono/diheme cytochrome c family protein
MNLSIRVAAVFVAHAVTSTLAAQEFDRSAVERGGLAVRGKPAMNPAVWSARAYDQLWKLWGRSDKPADFDSLLRERYGLYPAPYNNDGLPMGLHYSKGLLGKGIVNDCLLCHAGVVAGQTVIGLGNASLDLQGLFDDLLAIEPLPLKFPFHFSYGRGTIDPVNPAVFLMELRDAELKLQPAIKLDYSEHVSSDPPAWWLLKKKRTRNWTGGVQTLSMRIDMINLLSPLNSAAHIKKHETTFADIHAFVMNVEAPKYPFAIDTALAGEGRGLFNEHCARCHGAYGPGGKYPNKIVPLETLGTDRTLAESLSRKNLAYINASWFGKEKRPDGGYYTIEETDGYQAPPLDGVWATAPYFHNGSVPTIADVLNSKARPRIFTRSYGTAREDYDAERVGLKITVLDAPPSEKLPGIERRKVYDTTQPGRSNAGHTFGDQLTEPQRRAVVEYLKTL